MRKFFLNAEYLIGHNITSFDIPVVERILGIKIKAKLIDTLAFSWYLYPERGGGKHGLQAWGQDLGIAKPEIEDWHNLTVQEYIHRCEEDVRINQKMWMQMWILLMDIYGGMDGFERIRKYLQFKMEMRYVQEKNRWLVDRDHAQKALDEYSAIREEKINALRQVMPKVPVKVVRQRPKNFYKKDGDFSKRALDWIKLCNEHGFSAVDYEGDIEVITGWEEPNPGSNQQLKQWLFSLGWKPTEFKQNKKKEDVPQINLPFGKGVCPDIKRLEEEVCPELEALDGLSILNHRIPQIETLIKSIDEDGYAHAGIQGFTNTLRMVHSVLVNMPKPERPYSDGVRASLICRDDEVLLGSDLSSLEDKIKQHFIWPLDPEYVKSMQRKDFDPHLTLARMADAVSDEDIKNYQNKKDPDNRIKGIRSIYKNGNYACQYGAGVPRLVKTTGADFRTAKRIHEAYWKLNWAVKAVAEQQYFKPTIDGRMVLYNPISKLYYILKNEKDVFSTLVQGTAAFIFDYWLGLVYQKYPQLIGQFHDEFIIRIEDKEDTRSRAAEVTKQAIHFVNEQLKFNVELGCDIQFGKRYSEIH